MAMPAKRTTIWLLAGLLSLGVAAAIVWQGWGALVPALPKTLRVAVARGAQPGHTLIQALSRELAETGQDVRLSLVEVDDPAAASQALAAGRAELAVIRPDLDLPPNASAVVVVRTMPVLILSAEADALTMLGELEGKRVGLPADDRGLGAELQRALAQSGRAAATLVPLAADAAAAELRDKNVDAVLLSAASARAFSPSAPLGRIARAPRGLSLAPAVPDEVSALITGLSALPVGQSSLPSALRSEVEEVLAASHLLMADNALDASIVASLTERMFYARAALARRAGHAVAFTGLPTDNVTAAAIPAHKGAIQYYEREQQTFMERWSDVIWIGIASTGAMSSAGAWLARRLVMRRRDEADQVAARIIEIGDRARTAPDRAALAVLAAELDAITAEALVEIRTRDGSRKTVALVTLALEAARSAIRDRREDLATPQARPALVAAAPAEVRAVG